MTWIYCLWKWTKGARSVERALQELQVPERCGGVHAGGVLTPSRRADSDWSRPDYWLHRGEPIQLQGWRTQWPPLRQCHLWRRRGLGRRNWCVIEQVVEHQFSNSPLSLSLSVCVCVCVCVSLYIISHYYWRRVANGHCCWASRLLPHIHGHA